MATAMGQSLVAEADGEVVEPPLLEGATGGREGGGSSDAEGGLSSGAVAQDERAIAPTTKSAIVRRMASLPKAPQDQTYFNTDIS